MSDKMAVQVAESMLLQDIYALCQKEVELLLWLRQKQVIGDFTDENCGKCLTGRLRFVQDALYSKDGYIWRCVNRKCNAKVSVRKGSWFERSHSSLEQIMKLTYMWVW